MSFSQGCSSICEENPDSQHMKRNQDWLAEKGKHRVNDWAPFHLPVVENVCIHNLYLQGQCQHEDVQGHTEITQVNGVQALAAFQAAQNFP